MRLEVCSRHSAPAGWRCTVCHELLCPDCAAIRTISPVDMTVCVLCGEMAEVLRRDRRDIESFSMRALKGLAFPFTGLGLLGFAGTSLLLAFTWYFGPTMHLLGWCLALAGFFGVARSAGRGDGQFENAPFSDLLTSVGLPVLRFMVVTLPTWGGMWLADEFNSHALWWAAVVLAFVWTPTAFLGAAAGTPLLTLLNPLAVFGTVARIGADARRLSFFLFGLVLLALALRPVSALLFALPVPFFSTLLSMAVTAYPPFVAAHITGLLLLLHPEPFGWDNVSLQPVLADAVPRGVAVLPEERLRPAHLQPIDLPEPAAYRPVSQPIEPAAPAPVPVEGADTAVAPVEAPRMSLVELTTSSLPPLTAHAHDLLTHAMRDADLGLALDTFRATPELDAVLSVTELTWVGRAAASEADDALAVRALREACRRPPEAASSAAHVYLAKLLDERQGKTDEARGLLTRVVNDFPNTPAAAFASQWLSSKSG